MIIAVSVAATLNLSGSKSKPTAKTAYGVVSIPNHSYFVTDTTKSADGCHGTGNYTDLAGGGTVTISDNVGSVIATTNLAPGKIDVNGFCEFNFSSPKVPTNRGPTACRSRDRDGRPVASICQHGVRQIATRAFIAERRGDSAARATSPRQGGTGLHHLVGRGPSDLGSTKRVLADAGYCSAENLDAAADYNAEQGSEFFIATGRTKHDEPQPVAPRGPIPKSATRKQLLLRGLDGAQGEWLLLSACHNLRKLHGHIGMDGLSALATG
jgi:hypothetical protein